MTESLSNATEEMSSAADHLGKEESSPALSREENALRHLQDAQSSMEEAQDGMSGRQGSGGPGGRSPKRVLSRGRNQGAMGTQTDNVRLPRAEDYKPPKEFREELLKSLKEKYPKIYEDIIHKYYKRLAE